MLKSIVTRVVICLVVYAGIAAFNGFSVLEWFGYGLVVVLLGACLGAVGHVRATRDRMVK